MAKTTKKPASSGKGSARKTPTETPQNGAVSAEPVQNSRSPVARAEVAARAYEIYLSRGAGHGRDVEDWLEAESSLRDRR